MRIMWFFLYYKSQAFDLAAVLKTGGHDIDSGGVNGAVSQNIRQLSDIFFNAVKCPCEQLAQIVGEDLRSLHTSNLAKLFHRSPNITAIECFAGPRNKDGSSSNAVSLGVI